MASHYPSVAPGHRGQPQASRVVLRSYPTALVPVGSRKFPVPPLLGRGVPQLPRPRIGGCKRPAHGLRASGPAPGAHCRLLPLPETLASVGFPVVGAAPGCARLLTRGTEAGRFPPGATVRPPERYYVMAKGGGRLCDYLLGAAGGVACLSIFRGGRSRSRLRRGLLSGLDSAPLVSRSPACCRGPVVAAVILVIRCCGGAQVRGRETGSLNIGV